MATAYTLQAENGQVRVSFFGALRENHLVALEKEFATLRGGLSPGRQVVIFNTGALAEADEAARRVLVRIQRDVASWARRSVWVDARAAFRGMALWVMHLANDQTCKAVHDEAAANLWLQSNEPREEAASRKTGAGGAQ